jgi:four helix bundle protein
MGVDRYEDLVAWKLAAQLLDATIVIIESPKAQKDRSFCDQLLRAARSVCSNIAEGFGRFVPTDFARFLTIARGSLLEVDSLLHEATRRRLAEDNDIATARNLVARTLIAVTRLRTYLRSAKAPKRRARTSSTS